MPSDNNPDFDDEVPDTASRSGFDSASEMARGEVKEAAGTLTGDENLRDEGETQQYLADAEEKEALKAWERERQEP